MAPPVPGVKPAGPPPTPQMAQIQNDLMRKAESWNRDRVLQFKKLRARNIVTGLMLGTAVLGIYTYSIMAIRQETFLDDLNEPEKMEE